MSSIDDPLLKELLAALKEDTQRMASDLLSIITTNALIAVFALFLAFASLVRIIFFPPRFGPGPLPGLFETALTFVLFALSVVSIYNLLRLRERYARLQVLAEKLGR
jgi:hypothetical protein